MSFMAPQAYTKETLVKAFDWLQHQPANLKQVATSPDVLVGLYLKALRQGINNIDADAPVSSKKFIDDLKNLKKDFAQFEDAPPAQPATAPAPPTMHEMVQQATHSVQQQPSPRLPIDLDETTLQSLEYIQQRFNLSSRQEALRMAISVGIQRISRWD